MKKIKKNKKSGVDFTKTLSNKINRKYTDMFMT